MLTHISLCALSCPLSLFSYAYAELSAATGSTSPISGMDDDDEFGEIEMGESNGIHAAAAINVDNAKFTVEEEEEE